MLTSDIPPAVSVVIAGWLRGWPPPVLRSVLALAPGAAASGGRQDQGSRQESSSSEDSQLREERPGAETLQPGQKVRGVDGIRAETGLQWVDVSTHIDVSVATITSTWKPRVLLHHQRCGRRGIRMHVKVGVGVG